jgi:hypothetical protein
MLSGWAVIMVGIYFQVRSDPFDWRYLYAAIAWWVCGTVLVVQVDRWEKFLERPADAGDATVIACRRGGRMLVLYSPWDGYPSGLRVRLAWWAVPEMLPPGESVTFYGQRAGAGRVVVSSPARDMALVGTGRRRPALPPGEPAVQDAPQRSAGRRSADYLRWGPPAITTLALAAAAVATVLASAPQLTGYLTYGQLRAGDCVTGSNLPLGTDNSWPEWAKVVPCIQPHRGEVFFAGNAWPQSPTAYPGDDAISSRGNARCASAFQAYDGEDLSVSALSFYFAAPYGQSDWGSGDRSLLCVAYFWGPGSLDNALPVSYSVKGRDV